MANWFESGEAASLSFNLMQQGDFVIPDPATNVVLTIRNKLGATLHTESQTSAGSLYSFAVPALTNTLTGSNTIEARFVKVRYVLNGGAETLNENYQLSAFIPFTVTSESVRTYLGITIDELEDNEIDLLQAYHTLVGTYGSNFTTPFATEGVLSFAANKAVAIQAAINLAVGLPQRIAQKTDAEKASFQRATKFDPYKLIAKLEEELSETLAGILPSTDTTVGAANFSVSAGTDPFTGA
jgi:hypothetical protein